LRQAFYHNDDSKTRLGWTALQAIFISDTSSADWPWKKEHCEIIIVGLYSFAELFVLARRPSSVFINTGVIPGVTTGNRSIVLAVLVYCCIFIVVFVFLFHMCSPHSLMSFGCAIFF